MTNQQLWQTILGNLEVTISRGSFNMLKSASLLERQENAIVIGVSNAFVQSWIIKSNGDILKVLKQAAPETKEIKYQVGQQKTGTTPPAQPNKSGLVQTPAPQRSASP